ncbi:MAG: GNAT family N-acetyltransferase [Clostridia bacterium]|nr:GNAT family N-acetyltransferase [Clostridia bacterium]
MIETERLILKPFSSLTEEQKEETIKSWDNPFNARYNAEPNSRKSVEDLMERPEPTFTNIDKSLDPYYDTMFFRVAYDKITGKLIGSCRFGKYPESKTMKKWDFGYNVLLRHWSKGYGTEMVKKIIEIARDEGAKYIRGGADNDNFGSYHGMIKNGFKYIGIDKDKDFEFQLKLSRTPSKEDCEKEWKKHIKRYIKRKSKNGLVFGPRKYEDLQEIKRLIKKMVEEIQKGGDEDLLVQKYNEKVEAILAKYNQVETCEKD